MENETTNKIRPVELEGSLQAFKFPEILQFLAMGRMTGALSIDGQGRRVELSFKEGKIIGAMSKERNLLLGQMLVYAGHITRQILDEALASQGDDPDGATLGQILVERRLIDPDELRPMLRLQIEEEIWELFSWEVGDFRFEQGPVREWGPIEVSMEIEPLLLEGTRRMDEWQAICATINDPNEIYTINPDLSGPPEGQLDANTWRVLSLINGRLPVEAVVRLSNLGKFETYWALDQLIQTELVVRTEDGDENLEPKAKGGPSLGKASPSQGEAEREDGKGDNGALGSGRKSLFGFLGRIKSSNGTADQRAASVAQAPVDRPPAKISKRYYSEVGLVCAVVNHLIERLSAETRFFEDDDPKFIAEFWAKAQNHNPKSDLIRFENQRLDPALYERYLEFEGALSHPLETCRDDCLSALRLFSQLLRDRASRKLDDRTAEQMLERAVRPFFSSSTVIASPDFSLKRWKNGTL